MRLGLYILASIILMAGIGIFVYIINPNDFSYDLMGIHIVLPVAVWITIPMLILMLASLVHMMFYGTKNFFKFRKWETDSDSLNNALYWSILNEPKPQRFNLPKLKETASILQVSNVKVKGTVDGVSEKLQGALNIINEIDKGHCVDFKEKKLEHLLSKDNPIVIKNYINCLKKKDKNFIEKVLQSKDKYSSVVFEKALKQFAKTTDFTKAVKYSKSFNRDSFMILINRVTREDDLELSVTLLDEFIVDLNSELKCSDFLYIANVTKKQLLPDDNLKLFREYDSKYIKAQIAYLYLLFEYEMIEKAGEYLEEHDADEFIRFRALYDLKKEHNKYKITDLINIKHICNDI